MLGTSGAAFQVQPGPRLHAETLSALILLYRKDLVSNRDRQQMDNSPKLIGLPFEHAELSRLAEPPIQLAMTDFDVGMSYRLAAANLSFGQSGCPSQ